MDGQTEVVNKTLKNISWCVVQDHPICWEEELRQAEFSYNSMFNQFLWRSPFSIIYENIALYN